MYLRKTLDVPRAFMKSCTRLDKDPQEVLDSFFARCYPSRTGWFLNDVQEMLFARHEAPFHAEYDADEDTLWFSLRSAIIWWLSESQPIYIVESLWDEILQLDGVLKKVSRKTGTQCVGFRGPKLNFRSIMTLEEAERGYIQWPPGVSEEPTDIDWDEKIEVL